MDISMYVGDAVTFIHTVEDTSGNTIDLSDAEALSLTFSRPDKSSFSREAVLLNDGSDGKFKCSLSATDLNVHGKWQRQGFIRKKLSTEEWSGDIHDFAVQAKLNISL